MKKEEMSMEVRLLLAFGLMGLVLLASNFFMKPVPPANKPAAVAAADGKTGASAAATITSAATTAAATTAKEAAATKTTPRAAGAAKPVAGEIKAASEEAITVDTKFFHVTFSNKGAVARQWILKDYTDHNGKQLDVIYQPALGKVPAPFSLNFRERGPTADPNAVLYKTTQSEDGLQLAFEYSDGHADIKKTFQFGPQSYLVKITSEVTQDGAPLVHSLMWRGGFGDPSIQNPTSLQHATYYDQPNNKLQAKVAKDAKDGALNARGQFTFAGIEDSYFAAALLPEGKTELDQTTYGDTVPDKDGKDELRVGAGVSSGTSNAFSLFVGPKDNDLLRRIDPKLEQLVDWGFFGVIAKPLFNWLNWTNDRISHNYGWAIVLVTLAINMVLMPLKISSMKSSKKMQALQPQIKVINDKYKNLSLKDPKKADQNQELMDLYKKNDVNVAGGCVPLLIQLPFLWAFYKVLSVAIEMRGAHWLWVTDLSQPETLAIHILPLVMTGTTFISQKMTPSPGMDPSQQKMMMFMPLMMGYMFYFASSGLVLYWLTGNVVAIAQQWALNKFMPNVEVIPAPKTNKKGK